MDREQLSRGSQREAIYLFVVEHWWNHSEILRQITDTVQPLSWFSFWIWHVWVINFRQKWKKKNVDVKDFSQSPVEKGLLQVPIWNMRKEKKPKNRSEAKLGCVLKEVAEQKALLLRYNPLWVTSPQVLPINLLCWIILIVPLGNLPHAGSHSYLTQFSI